MEPMRAVMVGCGGITRAWLKPLQEMPDVSIVGLVDLVEASEDEIAGTVRRMVSASANPWLTGICCINLDERVSDGQIDALCRVVEELRLEYARTA